MQPFLGQISVALADDHPMVIKGIENMLQDHPNIIIEQVYTNGTELMNGLKVHQPDVLLLDLHMPKFDYHEALTFMVENYPTISILIVTNVEQLENVQQVLEKGALGYLLKSTDQHTLIEAIITVRNGKSYIDRELKEPLLEYVISEKRRSADVPSLSRREKQMLELIVKGLTNQQIAATLFLGQRTVETYRYNLMAKLKVKNTAALVRKAIEENLLR